MKLLLLITVGTAAGCRIPDLASLGAGACDESRGRGCGPGLTCREGRCVPPRAGEPDAGADGGSPIDGGVFVCPPLAALPRWRQGQVVASWKRVTTADLSLVTPQPVPAGVLNARIDSYGGLVTDTDTDTLYFMASGGGGLYSGNEVYGVNLRDDEPRWTIRTPPTPAAQVIENAAYYLDGRPSAASVDSSCWFSEGRRRLLRFGGATVWGGTTSSSRTDGWAPETNEWDAPDTWAAFPMSVNTGMPTAKDYSTGDIFQLRGGALFRWRQVDNAVFSLGPAQGGVEAGDLYGSPLVVDSPRRRLLFLNDRAHPGRLRTYGLDTAEWSSVSTTGVSITSENQMAFFDPCLERVVALRGASQVVTLDPATMRATMLVTDGDVPPAPQTGVHTLFQFVPRLGGYAFQPRGNGPLYFLATR